jgi:trehalose/maltose transport system substrate-binding protein
MHHDSSSPVTRLLAESLAGHVSRRDILKRASALGLSAPVVGILLSAQSRGALAQDATPAGESGGVGSTITVPEGLPTDLGGASITVIFGADGPSTPWEEAAIAKFTEATGINVTLTVGPTSATERLALYQQLLAAQATDADAMMIDIIWPGILAAHAVDLSEAIGWQDGDYFERLVENNTVNGVLVGIPWYTDAGLLYYRTDLLEKHGFEGPPVTWTELEEMATAIQEAERADNPDFQGYVWQGAAYMEEEARGVWQAGNAAFMRNWPYAYAPGQEEGSAIQGAFDVTQIPMGDGDGATHAATLGGWQVMVSRYSQNQPAAIAWAQYLTSRELQKSYAVELSRLPTIPSLYEDADVLEANPFFERLLPVFEGGSVARPSTVTADLYNQVSTAYFTALNEILTGQAADAAARVEQLAQQLDGIVSQL